MDQYGGYMLWKRNLDMAIEFYKLNTELFPDSYKVYESLAEAYLRKGEKDLAAAFFKKSLKLNPNNANAMRQINKLNTENK